MPDPNLEAAAISPSEEDILAAALKQRETEPGLAVAKLHARIKADNPTWTLSLNRLKAILRQHAATMAPPYANVPEEFRSKLYVGDTLSVPVPDLELPSFVEVFTSADRGGKGLQVTARTPIVPKDTLIWTEPALVLIPPLSLVGKVATGFACSYCARPIVSSSTLAVQCTTCAGKWCSSRCRKLDTLHKNIRHGRFATEWAAIEQYAIENEWSAVLLYAYCLAAVQFDVTPADTAAAPKTSVAVGINSLAKVRQDVRQRADPQMQSNIFLGDHLDMLWQEGYSVICRFFTHFSAPTYEEFLYGIGMVNINSRDGSIYLVQSHLNHSCEPSVDVKTVGRTAGIKVLAKRDLAPGEELTTNYIDLSKDLDARRKELLEGWGFWCTCTRCTREERGITVLPEIIAPTTTPTVPVDALSSKPAKTKPKKGKQKPKKKVVEEAIRTRKKSVTFDETVIQIEI
ncbi:uncharacterized protein V1518DRAFT_412217 [Limtongia smithiae]|uniref:uncharacterized protein n=1 Tax=Limtongia smithiae TaxID=1125753 RepID=UPI0034CF6A4A